MTRLFADLTDVTLADEDSNLIPTDDVNTAILGNAAMGQMYLQENGPPSPPLDLKSVQSAEGM